MSGMIRVNAFSEMIKRKITFNRKRTFYEDTTTLNVGGGGDQLLIFGLHKCVEKKLCTRRIRLLLGY